MEGQISLFDFIPKSNNLVRTNNKYNEKNCGATAEKCDCFCGIEHCCQNCVKPCDTRCSYSNNQQEVFDQSLKQWVRNRDFFNPIWGFIECGTGFANGKNRVRDYFKESHSQDEKIKFLKKEYGLGGFGFCTKEPCTVHDGDTFGKNIRIGYTDRQAKEQTEEITWKQLEKEITFLVSKDWY